MTEINIQNRLSNLRRNTILKLMVNCKDAFHFTKPEQLNVYASCIEEALATKLFAILAHPERFYDCFIPRWDEACEAATRQIAQAALDNDVILEVNANGLRRGKQTYQDGVRYPYPSEKFWSIIANEFPTVKVIVNSDCHNPAYLNDEYMQMARDMAKRLNLNVIERL